jgi:UDP-glucose 4-epimerase
MTTAFVTGGLGAIGSAVMAETARRGWRVGGLGHGAWPVMQPQPELGWLNGAVDGGNLSTLAAMAGKPGIILHLAGGSQVGTSLTQPAEDFRRTVVAAHELLEWVRLNSPETRIVLASSAAVYGSGHSGLISEDAPVNPMSPYGAHKAAIEMIAKSHGRDFGLSIAVVRLFSVYGPGLRKQLVFELANRLLAGETEPRLGGTGDERRDFLHIDDAARMLADAAGLASLDVPVLNGCTGRATTVAGLFGAMAGAVGYSGRPMFSGVSRAGDPFSLIGDPARAASHGLASRIALEAGLGSTIDWVSGSRQNPDVRAGNSDVSRKPR